MKRPMENEERRLVWLSVMLGPGSLRPRRLLAEFGGSGEEVFRAAAKGDLPPLRFLDAELCAKLKEKASERYIDRLLARLEELEIGACTIASPDYPALLKEIYDPPAVLYYKGTLYSQLRLPIAVIGSREPTEYGRRVAKELAKELAGCGACIVSGLARGVDRLVAEGALEAENSDYPTVAVLGNGPDVAYPGGNRDVYERIAERGALISEYMPGVEPRAMNFPTRNRIISGLSKGVVVVEAGEKSGTSITVDSALEQGRDVFAIPGRITDGQSAGTNGLLRAGMAKIVLSADDVLEEYGVVRGGKPTKTVDAKALPFEQQLIHRLLMAGERSFDELCELTGFDPAKLNYTLTEMEFSEIIKQSPGRLFGL